MARPAAFFVLLTKVPARTTSRPEPRAGPNREPAPNPPAQLPEFGAPMERPEAIALAHDVVLTSLRNGDAAIYWMSEGDWQACFGGRGLRLVTTIAEITPVTNVKFFGQYSYDGKVWTNFKRNLDGMTNGYIAVGTFESTYADSPGEFAPYVRIGIQVSCTGGEQAQVRLTSTAVVLFSNITSVYGVQYGSDALSTTSAATAIGNAFDASTYDEGQVLITYSGTPTALQFSVWTSADGGTNYGKLAEAAPTSAAQLSGEAIYIPLPYLGSKVQVRYTMGGGTSIACTSIAFIGRVN